MKYCRNCGAEVDENDVYCGYCGCKLKGDAPRDNGTSGQDFKDDSIDGADFSSDFGNDVETGFDDSFDQDVQDGRGFGKNEEPQGEFDSYVENGNAESQSFDVNRNESTSGHKTLLPNKLAKDANTFGILAFVFGFVFGILGIVFGIIGLQKSKKAMALCDTGEYDGKPKARDGRALSIAGIVLGVCWAIFYIF